MQTNKVKSLYFTGSNWEARKLKKNDFAIFSQVFGYGISLLNIALKC